MDIPIHSLAMAEPRSDSPCPLLPPTPSLTQVLRHSFHPPPFLSPRRDSVAHAHPPQLQPLLSPTTTVANPHRPPLQPPPHPSHLSP
jgi:hypothetical protein